MLHSCIGRDDFGVDIATPRASRMPSRSSRTSCDRAMNVADAQSTLFSRDVAIRGVAQVRRRRTLAKCDSHGSCLARVGPGAAALARDPWCARAL